MKSYKMHRIRLSVELSSGCSYDLTQIEKKFVKIFKGGNQIVGKGIGQKSKKLREGSIANAVG